MKSDTPLLTLRFDGEAVGAGRISMAHLLSFLGNMNKALLRMGKILSGESASLGRGSPKRSIRDEVALDLVLLTQGSPAAVLGFERRSVQNYLPGMDLGAEVLANTIRGLALVQEEGASLPLGYDSGVLMAWRDAGILFSQGITAVNLSLNHRASPLSARYTAEGLLRIQRRIQGPETNIRTFEGRLLMADFKEHGTRCRVHPSAGEPILCLFDDSQKEEVLDDILHYVRIIGEANEDALTGKIISVKIRDIERIENMEDEAANLLPQGLPLVQDFWNSPSLDELAQAQDVKPLEDIRALLGTWPGESDDGFDSLIDELRHPPVVREARG